METSLYKETRYAKILIIRYEAKLQPRDVYAHIGLCSKRIKILRGEFGQLRGTVGNIKC